MTDLFQGFNDQLNRRFSKAYADQTTSQWIAENTTIGGKPFSFEDYEFQREIVDDLHPNLSVIKCSQVGLTECQIRKALAFVNRNNRVNLIFTLPSEDMYRRMSQTRVKPIVDKDKVFNLTVDDDAVRSMAIMQFGHSFLFLSPCSEGSATSTAADAVFNDEIDLSDQSMLALFNSRMQDSDIRMSQGFSTPTFQNFGIDSLYKASDQRKYLIKCPSCNHWNWPEFNQKFCKFPDLPSHIEDLIELDQAAVDVMDLGLCFVGCEKCGKNLDGAKKQWVATFPGRTNARGYWVPPFATSRIKLPYIVGQLLRYKQRDFLRGFHNTVLGRTYSDAQTQISLDAIEVAMMKGKANIVELPNDAPLAIGCDMGQTCHLVVGPADGTGIYLFEQVPAKDIVERIQTLFKTKNIVAGAVDRLPYTPTAEEIAKKTNNIVLPMQYTTGKDSDIKLVEDEYEKLSHFSINRTRILDEVAAAFRLFNIQLSGYGHQKQIVIEHLRDMVRQEKPESQATWEKLSGNDHYFHAIGLYFASLRVRPLVQERESGATGTGSAFSFSTITTKFAIPSGLPGFSPKRTF